MVSDFTILFIINKNIQFREERELLTRNGYHVDLVSSSADIRSELTTYHPDLIISREDILGSQIEVFSGDLQEMESTFPLILLLEESDCSSHTGYRGSPVDYLIKPFTDDFFINRIEFYKKLWESQQSITSRAKELEKELEEQKKFDQQRTEFWKIAVFSEDSHDMVESLLILLGDFLDLERISFFTYLVDQQIFTCRIQWIKGQGLFYERCRFSEEDFMHYLSAEYTVPNDSSLQKLKNKYPDFFLSTKSQLTILYGTKEMPKGFFLLEEFEKRRKWRDHEIQLARELSNIIRLKTDLLKYAKEMADSERKFRIISEASRDLICIHNLKGEFEYVSPSSFDILGYSAGELTGKSLYDFIHPDDNFPFFQDIYDQRNNFNQDNKVEYRIRRKDGSYIWFETIIQPITFQSKNATEFQTSSRDVTSRKLAEDKIRESEIKYRNIFESMHDIYAEVEIETGKILEVSPSVHRITGYDREELLGKSIEVFGIDLNRRKSLIQDLLANEKVSDYEVVLKTRDGRKITCSYSVRTVNDKEGKPYKMVGTLRDISQRKNYEKELRNAKLSAEAASNAKSQFLANMSHEIRTPLNAILGFSEVLINKEKDPEDISHLEAILSSGQTLLAIINDILDLSKIESGKFKITEEPVHIHAIIEDVRHIFEKKIRDKGLDFYIDLEKTLPPTVLLLDEIRIRQILFNLVGNAIKFTEKGYIKISGELNKKESGYYDLSLAVSDTGIGIPKKQQRLIFQSFQQDSGQDSRKYEGTGLGLTITKKLIDMMGGEIKLESRIGKGSIFKVNLFNLAESSYEKIETQQKMDVETEIDFHPATILIADDLQYNIDAVKGLINSDNLNFIEALTAEKAIEIVKIKRPDLILMDLRFSDMSGYEATAYIKAENKGIPVIAFTASTIHEEESHVMNIFDDYLRKPVSRNDLFAKLKSFLPFERKEIDSNIKEKSPVEVVDIIEGLDYNYLISILKNDFLSAWEEIKDNLVIFKIENFCNELKSLVNKFPDPDLVNYVEKLRKELNEFDINSLQTLIKEFPDIITKIEKKL